MAEKSDLLILRERFPESDPREAAYTTKVDGIRMRNDGVHPTPEAVKWLTPWLTDALR